MALITKLPDSTIRLIAAGEVITRPYNIVKELLENSLDAGATNIRITIEQGGVKLIEIIDNGHGIARANAGLLCQRYTTSKLQKACDLYGLSTFGFRGEALASVSEMADLEVRTFNIQADTQGWQAKYKSGQLVEIADKYLQNPGTHIRVTNLFFWIDKRRSAMKTKFLDEKKAIIELVMNYAIYYRDKVTMILKEDNSSDLICSLAPIKIGPCFGSFFGLEIESNLIEMTADNTNQYKAEVHIVFSFKKSTNNLNQNNFILFVNKRLVSCPDMKKEIDAVISEYLNTKIHSSITYVALEVPAEDVDVNTHPAKATVSLHYQLEIIALIISVLKAKLKESLSTKAIPPSTPSQKSIAILTQKMLPTSPVSSKPTHTAIRPHDLVHNDSSQQTLAQLSKSWRSKSPIIVPPKHPRRDVKLISIRELKLKVSQEKSLEVTNAIKNSVFVGIFDHDCALIQLETKLYAINLKAYIKELYYQFFLFDFGNYPPIDILPPGNRIRYIISTYLDDLEKYEPDVYDKLEFRTSDTIIEELLDHAPMFEDYLTLKITKDEILTIPCICPSEVPNLTYLGKFLVDLVNSVDYSEEQECFRMIGRIVADFYSEPPANLKDRGVHKRYHDKIETKLYPAIKSYLLAPDWLFSRENIRQISDTKDLYKVFERC